MKKLMNFSLCRYAPIFELYNVTYLYVQIGTSKSSFKMYINCEPCTSVILKLSIGCKRTYYNKYVRMKNE